MKTKQIYILCLLFTGIAYFTSCDNKRIKETTTIDTININQEKPIDYNIYIENSGSMAGYCNYQDDSAIETLIDDYYERLSSQSNTKNVTLNFINTSIEKRDEKKKEFLKSIKERCTEQYTKIDEMLRMMMNKVNDNNVNILISDFVFTTDDGNFTTAASSITSLITKQLNKKDFSVAIIKYMRNFNGKYYPGGLPCNKPLPIYVWAFGKKENVHKFTLTPFVTKSHGIFCMQKPSDLEFTIEAKNKRMINNHKLFVSKWEKVRNEKYYELNIRCNMSDVLLDERDLLNKKNFVVSSNNSTKYIISDIDKCDAKNYLITIRTDNSNPAPGELTLKYPIKTPLWISNSNFIGKGIPTDGTTLGIKYLIEGVNKAFKDATNDEYNYFEIKINLE